MNQHETYAAADLARLARLLPAPLLDDASAGMAAYIEEDFQHPTAGLYNFGERLIYTAGLMASALYLDLTSGGGVLVDHRLVGHIRTLLFNRPYDSGLATCILERLAIAGPSVGIVLTGRSDRIGGYFLLKRDTPANTYRARHAHSLEDHLADVFEYLAFLREVRFVRTDTVRFRNRNVGLWPFLRWDGRHLSAFRESRMHASENDRHRSLPKRIIYVRHEDYEEREEVVDIVPLDRVRLAELAERVRHAHTDGGTDSFARDSESFIPLLVGNYSGMDRLVDLIMAHANAETKSEWIAKYLKKGALGATPSSDDVEAALSDDTKVENAILSYALEFDPIFLLKELFEAEREDIKTCIRLLDPLGADQTLASIQERIDRLETRIKPLYVRSAAELKKLLHEHRARLASVEAARLLGFKVRHVTVRESIEDYAERVADFYGYIKEHPDEKRLDDGLRQCCIVCEEVLEFLHFFYFAVEGFDASSESGLSIESRSILQREVKATYKVGLGNLVTCFSRLCERYEVGLPYFGQRRQLKTDAQPHLGLLNRLNTWRTSGGEVHRDKTVWLSIEERIELVRGVGLFLQWLRKPNESRSGSFERIYPAVLQLNVLTTNRCGVTSVKYVLHEITDDDSIRLYTQQRVAGIAGVFYGLPVQGRGNAELWVDPVLFAAEAFENAAVKPQRPMGNEAAAR